MEKISEIISELRRRKHEKIMNAITVDMVDDGELIDIKVIDRCTMLIQGTGQDAIETFCFDGKPLLRFHPIKTKMVLDDGKEKIVFEQYVEKL